MRQVMAVAVLSMVVAGCNCGSKVNKIQPSVTVAPTGLSFDSVKVGESAIKSVRLEAKTNTLATVKSITLEPGTAPGGLEGFKLGTLPTSIAPLDSASFTIAFAPQAVQQYAATLVIVTDDAEKPTVRIPVVGEGALPVMQVTPECSLNRQCNGTVSVDPLKIDFGAEPLRRATPIDPTRLPNINVVNAGTVTLKVTVNAISGTDAAAFSIAGNSVQPGTTLELEPTIGAVIPIRFVPTSGTQTNYSAQLTLDSDDPQHTSVTVQLVGRLMPNQLPQVCANLIRVTPPPTVDAPRDYSQRSDWQPLLVPSANGYDFRKTRDVRPGELVQFSALSDATDMTACTTDAEDGRTGLTWLWVLTSYPTGALGLAIGGASSPQAQLRPVVTGDYVVSLIVTDSQGGQTAVSMQFSVAARQDLVAQLQWLGFSDVDLDLHLVRPQATDAGFAGAFGFFSEGTTGKIASDINGYADGLRKAQPASAFTFDWGLTGASDDPVLNVDDKGQGALLENIALNSPENDPACATQSCTYKVMVHYFNDLRVSSSPACQVTGATGCRDGEPCTCAAERTCVADALPVGDAGVGPGKCDLAPRPVVRLFFRGATTPAATIPLESLTPPDVLTLGAPCQMIHVADISWPAKSLIGSLPDGGTPPPVVTVIGADGSGRVVAPEVARFGYRQSGGSRRCSPDFTQGGTDWYSRQP